MVVEEVYGLFHVKVVMALGVGRNVGGACILLLYYVIVMLLYIIMLLYIRKKFSFFMQCARIYYIMLWYFILSDGSRWSCGDGLWTANGG